MSANTRRRKAAAVQGNLAERPMDPRQLERLAGLIRAGAPAVGVEQSAVEVGRLGVVISGTGIDVEWRRDARGRGMPGWVVTETFHELNLLTEESGMVTEAVVAGEDGDEFEIACRALLQVSRRKIEFAMEASGA